MVKIIFHVTHAEGELELTRLYRRDHLDSGIARTTELLRDCYESVEIWWEEGE